MDSGHRVDVEEALKTHHIIPLPAFDFHDEEIKPEDLTRILKGALVSMTFTLRYGIFHDSIFLAITICCFPCRSYTFLGAAKDRLHEVNGFL